MLILTPASTAFTKYIEQTVIAIAATSTLQMVMKTLLVIFEDTTSIRHAYQTPPVDARRSSQNSPHLLSSNFASSVPLIL